MQPDHEEGLAAEAEREARVARILTHPRIPPAARIQLVQEAELSPEQPLELQLAGGHGRPVDGDEGGEVGLPGAPLVQEHSKIAGQLLRGLARAQHVLEVEAVGALPKRGSSAETRKLLSEDPRPELIVNKPPLCPQVAEKRRRSAIHTFQL